MVEGSPSAHMHKNLDLSPLCANFADENKEDELQDVWVERGLLCELTGSEQKNRPTIEIAIGRKPNTNGYESEERIEQVHQLIENAESVIGQNDITPTPAMTRNQKDGQTIELTNALENFFVYHFNEHIAAYYDDVICPNLPALQLINNGNQLQLTRICGEESFFSEATSLQPFCDACELNEDSSRDEIQKLKVETGQENGELHSRSTPVVELHIGRYIDDGSGTEVFVRDGTTSPRLTNAIEIFLKSYLENNYEALQGKKGDKGDQGVAGPAGICECNDRLNGVLDSIGAVMGGPSHTITAFMELKLSGGDNKGTKTKKEKDKNRDRRDLNEMEHPLTEMLTQDDRDLSKSRKSKVSFTFGGEKGATFGAPIAGGSRLTRLLVALDQPIEEGMLSIQTMINDESFGPAIVFGSAVADDGAYGRTLDVTNDGSNKRVGVVQFPSEAVVEFNSILTFEVTTSDIVNVKHLRANIEVVVQLPGEVAAQVL